MGSNTTYENDKERINVEPHTYAPLSLLDAWRGRCRHCLWPRRAHPIHFWAVARVHSDTRRYDEREAADAEFGRGV